MGNNIKKFFWIFCKFEIELNFIVFLISNFMCNIFILIIIIFNIVDVKEIVLIVILVLG